MEKFGRFLLDSFNCFEWFGISVNRPLPFDWLCPFNRIDNDPLNLFIMISWVRFMARTEIKYFSIPASVRTAASKYFSTFKPACKDHFIRCRDIKMLPVHFFFFQLDILANSLCNWMAWRYNPKTFFFIGFT